MTPDQIMQLLDQLGQRLEGPAKYVFDLAVRQTIITGVLSTLTALAGLVGLVVTYYVAKKVLKAGLKFVEGSYDESFDRGLAFVLVGLPVVVVTGSLLAIIGSNITTSVNYLLNPEYWTLMNLVKVVIPS